MKVFLVIIIGVVLIIGGQWGYGYYKAYSDDENSIDGITYEPYENLTAGIYAKSEDELLQGLTDIINGVDNYKEKRKALRDRMFVYQDDNNCERNVEFIKSLRM